MLFFPGSNINMKMFTRGCGLKSSDAYGGVACAPGAQLKQYYVRYVYFYSLDKISCKMLI